MSDPVGFIVEGVVTDTETYFHVIGRCGDTPISVGDEFQCVFAPAGPPGGQYKGLGAASSVSLKVERIQAYQRQLTQLGSGMTGTIDVRGEGLDRVVPGAVLKTPDHDVANEMLQKNNVSSEHHQA